MIRSEKQLRSPGGWADVRRRHHEALIQAEARRLRHILCVYGPLPHDTLRRLAKPGEREIDLDSALRAGVHNGEIRALGLGFYEAMDQLSRAAGPVGE